MKVCKKCNEEKELNLFYKNKECSFGRENICKKCRNKHTIEHRDKRKHSENQQTYYFKNKNKLKEQEKQRYYTKQAIVKNTIYIAKYSISLAEAVALLQKQENTCKICLTELSLDVGAENAGHVDHCHTTGKIRGILCSKCNTGLGLFRDNVNNLQSAINYLNDSKQEDN